MSLKDDMTKHRIFVQRLAGTEYDSIKQQLKHLEKIAKLNSHIDSHPNTLKQVLRKSIKNMSDIALKNMTDIAVYESKFSAKIFNKYFDKDIKAVTEATLQTALVKTNISLNTVKTHSHNGVQRLVVNENAQRKSLITAYDQFGRRKADELTQVIKDSKVLKLSAGDTAKAIEEKMAGLFSVQAKTLALTAVNYSTNVAKTETISENSDVIKQEQWITQLEDGTCGYCEDNSDQVYDEGEAPECPAHFNCNCEVIPYVE